MASGLHEPGRADGTDVMRRVTGSCYRDVNATLVFDPGAARYLPRLGRYPHNGAQLGDCVDNLGRAN
jgi:hypothetical protein